MRSSQRVCISRSAIVAALAAVTVFAGIETAAAQFSGGRGFGMSGGRAGFGSPGMAPSRVTTMPRTSTGMPMSQPRQVGKVGATMPGKDGMSRPPRGPYGPVVGDKTPPRPGMGTHPPHHPHPPRGPGYGPVVVGTGVAIGTGVVVGSAAAAPPPPPRVVIPAGPTGPQGRGPSNAGSRSPAGGPLITLPSPDEQRYVPNEVLLEFAANYSPDQITALSRRHRLARLELVNVPSTNSTYFRARITDGRPVATVLNALRRETALRTGQPNFLFRTAEANFEPRSETMPQAVPAAAAAGAMAALGDPAQYALAKLRLREVHSITRGDNVLVAVIDTGIDTAHPELDGVIAGSFDALNKPEAPHTHGTAMAGTIAARSRLSGVAPFARILAIRAFSHASAEGTTFALLRGIDHAARMNARVINMSFAGPNDPGLARALAAARARGIVLVAAAGNFGPKSGPQYPAADPNVIAVTATDADDRLFSGANRGRHIAVAAPGVDILVPAPGGQYDITTGTSVAAAHVSGVVALILARNPDLDPQSVRQQLLASARDLGPTGRDDQFGAGLTDAFLAVLGLQPSTVSATGGASGTTAR